MKMRSALVATLVIVTTMAAPAAATVTLPPPSITLPSSGSFMYLNSEAGDWVGQGQERLFTTAGGTIAGAVRGSRFGGAVYTASSGWSVAMYAPDGQPLVVGSYTGAGRAGFQPAGTPGLEITGEGRGCNTLTGQFDVTQLAFSSLGEITLFDATFEQHCEGGLAPALYGRIRIESPAPAPGSTLPPGSITVPTSGTFLYLIKTNTSVGNYEQLYTSADSTFDWSWPYSDNSVFHATVIQGNYVHWWYLDIAAAPGNSLAVGHYANAVRFISRTAGTPGIDVTGDGRGCNEVSGSFDVDELSFAWNYEMSVFQATFHFYCDNSLSLQHGRIRIEHATPPQPPPVTLGVTLDDKGKASDASGYATIYGSVSCSRSVPVDLRGYLTQTKPDHTVVQGAFSGTVDCITPVTRWSMPAGGTDKFGASTATASVTAYYCDALRCDTAFATRTVKLNQGNK
jgi:hypothetical protein